MNALVGKRLVALDECRRADHIGVQDDGELSRLTSFHWTPPRDG
jgi:hypothetical protein